jgi:hypothetical protein
VASARARTTSCSFTLSGTAFIPLITVHGARHGALCICWLSWLQQARRPIGRTRGQQAEGLPRGTRRHQPQRARVVDTHQNGVFTDINGILVAFSLCSGCKGWLQFLLLAKVSRLQLDYDWVWASPAEFNGGVAAWGVVPDSILPPPTSTCSYHLLLCGVPLETSLPCPLLCIHVGFCSRLSRPCAFN